MAIPGKSNVKLKYIAKTFLFCVAFTVLLVSFSFLKSFISMKYERFAYGVIATFVSLLTTYLFLRFDKKSFSDIGLRFEKTTIIKFVSGMLLGILLMGLMAMSVIYFSGLKLELNKNSGLLIFLFWTSPFILLAFMEEVGFRGYPLMILKNKVGLKMSIVITAILFALYHIVNGWTLTGAFLGPGISGIVFGLSAIYSNGISMPTGMHYTWNLVPSAFGISGQSFNIWILKQKNGLTLENYETSQVMTLVPPIILLILSIICMELFLKKQIPRGGVWVEE